jgi:arylsulfatase
VRGVTQSPIEGVSFAHAFSGRQGRDAPPHAVLRDDRPPVHLSRRLASRSAGAGPSFAEAGMGSGEMPITEEKLRELDAKGWELYHVDEDFSGDT